MYYLTYEIWPLGAVASTVHVESFRVKDELFSRLLEVAHMENCRGVEMTPWPE